MFLSLPEDVHHEISTVLSIRSCYSLALTCTQLWHTLQRYGNYNTIHNGIFLSIEHQELLEKIERSERKAFYLPLNAGFINVVLAYVATMKESPVFLDYDFYAFLECKDFMKDKRFIIADDMTALKRRIEEDNPHFVFIDKMYLGCFSSREECQPLVSRMPFRSMRNVAFTGNYPDYVYSLMKNIIQLPRNIRLTGIPKMKERYITSDVNMVSKDANAYEKIVIIQYKYLYKHFLPEHKLFDDYYNDVEIFNQYQGKAVLLIRGASFCIGPHILTQAVYIFVKREKFDNAALFLSRDSPYREVHVFVATNNPLLHRLSRAIEIIKAVKRKKVKPGRGRRHIKQGLVEKAFSLYNIDWQELGEAEFLLYCDPRNMSLNLRRLITKEILDGPIVKKLDRYYYKS